MVELNFNIWGNNTELEGTGQIQLCAEHFRQLVRDFELGQGWFGRIYGIGEHHRADFSISPRDCAGRWGSQHQENPFLTSAVSILSNMPDSFVPTVCHYRCFVKWTRGEIMLKGLFHGIFPSVWL